MHAAELTSSSLYIFLTSFACFPSGLLSLRSGQEKKLNERHFLPFLDKEYANENQAVFENWKLALLKIADFSDLKILHIADVGLMISRYLSQFNNRIARFVFQANHRATSSKSIQLAVGNSIYM